MARKKQKFLRIGYTQYSKLGLRRKKKQKYRKATGVDNKVRLNLKGHLRNVKYGFRTQKKFRNLINGFKPQIIYNVEELKKLKKDEIAIFGKIGNKKKIELCKYSIEYNIKINNINPKKFLEKIEAEKKKKTEEKDKKTKEAEKKTSKIEEAKKEEIKKEEKLEDIAKNKNNGDNKKLNNEEVKE
jgi:ribosomal protein L32E